MFLMWGLEILFKIIYIPTKAFILMINELITTNLKKIEELVWESIIFSAIILLPYILLKNIFNYFFYLKYVYIILTFTISIIATIITMLNYQTFCLIASIGSFIINLVITIILFLIFTILAATVTLNEENYFL